MEIKIAEVCGLCAGCKRAINTAQELLKTGNKVTIFKEIVHNENVNANLRNLRVVDHVITPDFNKDTLEYNISIPTTQNSFSVEAETNDSKSKISYNHLQINYTSI